MWMMANRVGENRSWESRLAAEYQELFADPVKMGTAPKQKGWEPFRPMSVAAGHWEYPVDG